MAPTAPTKRKSLRSKATSRLTNPLLARKHDIKAPDTLSNSKKDRRTIKHTSFVSRISKVRPLSHSSKNKKRKPSNKKLVTTLQSLADALPKLTEADGNVEELARGKIRHKSLKSRPGALKKKERLVRGEMERFGASLAQLSTVKEVPSAAGGGPLAGGATDVQKEIQTQPAVVQQRTSNRFAALREFISATMEQNPAFSHQGP